MPFLDDVVAFLDEYAKELPQKLQWVRIWQFEDVQVCIDTYSKAVQSRFVGDKYWGPDIRSLKSLASSIGLLCHDEWEWDGVMSFRASVQWGADYELGERPIPVISLERLDDVCGDPPSLWWCPWHPHTDHPHLLSFARSLVQGRVPVPAFFDFVEENNLPGEGTGWVLERARSCIPKYLFSNHELQEEARKEVRSP
jgi:hypothetical protein